MKNETLTVEDVLRMRPCGMDTDGYTPEWIRDLWAGRERLTLLEVLDLDMTITVAKGNTKKTQNGKRGGGGRGSCT